MCRRLSTCVCVGLEAETLVIMQIENLTPQMSAYKQVYTQAVTRRHSPTLYTCSFVGYVHMYIRSMVPILGVL